MLKCAWPGPIGLVLYSLSAAMEGLWRAVGCQRQGIWAIWFSGLSREGCFSLLVLWGNIENCIALGLGSVISYLFMLLGQGMCLLCPPVPLVPLPASLPTLAWPVGTIWGLAEDCQGCFVASTGFRSCSYSLVDWGILPGSFSFSGNVLSSSSFSFCVQHTLFSICNEKKIEFVNREIPVKIL